MPVRRLVAVAMPAGPRFVEELERAWEAGDAVLPVDLRLAPPARRRLLEALRPAVLITGGGPVVALSDPEPVEEGDALVMATSGTTGEPKGVVLTHAAVSASARATSARIGVDAGYGRLVGLPPPLPRRRDVGRDEVPSRGGRCEVVEGFSVGGGRSGPRPGSDSHLARPDDAPAPRSSSPTGSAGSSSAARRRRRGSPPMW